MGRRLLAVMLVGGGLSFALGCGGSDESTESAPPSRPNVVLVSVDTLRADALGVYGGPVPTPAFDGLARDGILFERAVAPAPETAPSHVTLFTGMDVGRHGVSRNGIPLGPGVTLAERFRDAGFATGGFASSFILDPRFGWDRGFDRYDATFSRTGETLHNRQGFWRHFDFDGFDRRAPATNRAAWGWLETAEEPFFLFVHYFDPHAPYAAPAGAVKALPDGFEAETAAGRWESLRGEVPGVTEAALAGILRHYQAEVLLVDAALAQLLELLERRGVAERTIVAVTADHGEGLGQHGTLDHAPHLYEEQLRVPLLLRWPGELPAGARVETPVGLVDLAPTLAALAGAPLEGADGRSLADALRAGRDPAPRPVFGRRRLYRKAHHDHRGAKYFVRDGDWKYIRATDDPDELYDLSSDPHELDDALALQREVANRLGALLDARLAEQPPPPEVVDIPDDVRRGLEALGYVE